MRKIILGILGIIMICGVANAEVTMTIDQGTINSFFSALGTISGNKQIQIFTATAPVSYSFSNMQVTLNNGVANMSAKLYLKTPEYNNTGTISGTLNITSAGMSMLDFNLTNLKSSDSQLQSLLSSLAAIGVFNIQYPINGSTTYSLSALGGEKTITSHYNVSQILIQNGKLTLNGNIVYN